MQPDDEKNAADARAIVEQRGPDHLKVGFCDVIRGWDSSSQHYDKVDFTGWHTGYGDAGVGTTEDSKTHHGQGTGTLFRDYLKPGTVYFPIFTGCFI